MISDQPSPREAAFSPPPAIPIFAFSASITRFSIGSTTSLEIINKDTASSLIFAYLLSTSYSIVDIIYIKGTNCESSFKKAGFEMGQEFLVRQPDNGQQCLKSYQVSGQSRDGKIKKPALETGNWQVPEFFPC